MPQGNAGNRQFPAACSPAGLAVAPREQRALPTAPGRTDLQDKTKANTRRTLGGTMALQRRGCFQHSAEKELLALKPTEAQVGG